MKKQKRSYDNPDYSCTPNVFEQFETKPFKFDLLINDSVNSWECLNTWTKPGHFIEIFDQGVKSGECVGEVSEETESSSNSGDEAKRINTEMKLRDVFELYQTAAQTETTSSKQVHAKEVEDSWRLYLAQCPLDDFPLRLREEIPSTPFSRDPRNHHLKHLKFRGLQGKYIWMSLDPGTISTTWHYDSNPNFLCVIVGHKIVNLLAPSHGHQLKPYKIGHRSSNHTSLSFDETNNIDVHGESVYTVKAGEGIFIPEGWWHKVCSDGGTIAVNYWYEGIRKTLWDSEMGQYYIRTTLEHLVATEKNKVLTNANASEHVHLVLRPFFEKGNDLQALSAFVSEHRSEWLRIVTEITHTGAALLAAKLDDGDPSVVGKIFEHESDFVKQVLEKKLDEFSKACAQNVLKSLDLF
uniref:JmjC domain-containing protein n=1 Tax=Aplanochytrium stocchinoi TaxID=215587 RepID=A0A7S3LUP7_9STRA